jgi:hypothetical protein
MKRVQIESPFAGDVEANICYARKCVRDSLLRGEAPYASHLLYTQKGILDDLKPEERKRGMGAGFEYLEVADLVAVYTDRGISNGMKAAIEHAKRINKPIEFRSIVIGHLHTGLDHEPWMVGGSLYGADSIKSTPRHAGV